MSILLTAFAIADEQSRIPKVLSDSRSVGWKPNATADWKPAVQDSAYRRPSWRLSCEHLAHGVRDSGRAISNPKSSFGLEKRWLEAQRDRRLEVSGT
jgi:hypothetical protein